MILQEKPNAMDIDPGNFNIESFGQAQAHLIGWNVRSKTAALKVMRKPFIILVLYVHTDSICEDRLMGNIWFGARLVSASLFESDGKGVTPLPTSIVPSNHPEDLGLVYRISETNIRRIEYGPSNPGVGLSTWPSSYEHSVSQQATVPLAVYPQTGMSYFNSSYPMFTTQQLQEVAQNFTQPSIGTLTPTMISSDPRSASMAYPQGQYLLMTTLPSMYDVQAHQPFPGMGPTYYANPNGALVNVAHGAHPVRSRGVFVRNLPHHAKQKHLEDFFRSAGTITHCVLNAKKKKISTAEVFFATEDEAKSAVKHFDGSTFLGRKIEVKLNSTDEALESSDSAPNTEAPLREGEGTSSRPGPIIVNGSIEGAFTE